MSKKHVKTPAAVRKAAGNTKYVASVHGDKIYYTDAFYRAMYDALHAGKNPVEAYKDLGFNVEELGENRAFAAAQRAEKKAEDGFVNMDEFDGIVDPATLHHGKPDPEIYEKAQAIAGLKADEVISFEDAKAGVEAIKAAGQFAVGIGDKELLKEADYIVPTTAELKLSEIEKVFNEK